MSNSNTINNMDVYNSLTNSVKILQNKRKNREIKNNPEKFNESNASFIDIINISESSYYSGKISCKIKVDHNQYHKDNESNYSEESHKKKIITFLSK